MSSQTIPVSAFDCVIFGGTGDLAERKILPALYHRQIAGQFTDPTRILGASRGKLNHAEYRVFAKNALETHLKEEELDQDQLNIFLERLYYIPIDVRSDNGWGELSEWLTEGADRVRAFYLAVGPGLFGDITDQIKKFDLVTEKTRIVVEKPLGRDLPSAKALNDKISSAFKESQIFRIDHYLGKETVQNLMALRFANALYEPLWNSRHVDHVQITVAETVGLEDRAGYYDKAGAMRDMVQNHILQLLCLVAMEVPSSIDADAVRDEKLKVLRALKPLTGSSVAESTVRAQYKAGASSGAAVKGYLEELDGESDTETFVAIRSEIENWRWSGVPFYLRTGKRLEQRVSEIVINFKPVPHSVFDDTAGQMVSNQLVIRLQPDEGVRQWIMIKDPGPGGMRLKHVPLDMSFAESFGVRNPDAYERLIMDVIRGNQTLFMRRDEVEAAWAWVDPILETWAEKNQKVETYGSGSWGPTASTALIVRDNRTWHEES